MLLKYEEHHQWRVNSEIYWDPKLVVAITLDLNHETNTTEPVNLQLLGFVFLNRISDASSTLLMFTQVAFGHQKPSELFLFFYHYDSHITIIAIHNRHIPCETCLTLVLLSNGV